MKQRIYYAKPSITEREVAYATDAARNGWGDRCYEYIGRFEEMFKAYVGTKYSIATSSCTGALHMGLAALGISPGDEVILADTNWIATAAPITYLGAKPIFVDILPDTWCIDPELAEAAITSRTKAIIATHLYGNLCEINRLLEIAHRHGLALIEDAAEGIGSRWEGQHVGSLAALGVFSFHGSKTITTGEGGMLVTNDKVLYEKVLTLSNHGRTARQARQFWPDFIGFKYKITNVQAAIGCAQMERIDELVLRKRKIFEYYHDRLGGLDGVSMNPEKPETTNGYWMPALVLARETGITRDQMQACFRVEGIDARVFFHPLSGLPMFESQPQHVHSYDIPSRAINLPSYHDMTDAEQDAVVATIMSLFPATSGVDARCDVTSRVRSID